MAPRFRAMLPWHSMAEWDTSGVYISSLAAVLCATGGLTHSAHAAADSPGLRGVFISRFHRNCSWWRVLDVCLDYICYSTKPLRFDFIPNRVNRVQHADTEMRGYNFHFTQKMLFWVRDPLRATAFLRYMQDSFDGLCSSWPEVWKCCVGSLTVYGPLTTPMLFMAERTDYSSKTWNELRKCCLGSLTLKRPILLLLSHIICNVDICYDSWNVPRKNCFAYSTL